MARDTLRSQITFAMVPTWVLERCSSQAVHIYALLMRRANRDRRAWPKTELLAAEMGKSLRTVERAIAELRKAGAIETTRRHGQNGWVLGLDFVLIQVDPVSAILPATRDGQARPVQTAINGGMGQRHPATGVVSIPPPVAEQEELDPENQIQEQEESTEPAAPALPLIGQAYGKPELNAADPCEGFLLAWNETIGPPLKPVTTLTPKRTRLIRARLTERPIDVWREIVARIADSSFCLGAKGWIASFDWLIASPDPAVKTLEGQYDDHVSENELTAAREHQFRTGGGCRHEPRCADWRTCVRPLALVLRTQRAS